MYKQGCGIITSYNTRVQLKLPFTVFLTRWLLHWMSTKQSNPTNLTRIVQCTIRLYNCKFQTISYNVDCIHLFGSFSFEKIDFNFCRKNWTLSFPRNCSSEAMGDDAIKFIEIYARSLFIFSSYLNDHYV